MSTPPYGIHHHRPCNGSATRFHAVSLELDVGTATEGRAVRAELAQSDPTTTSSPPEATRRSSTGRDRRLHRIRQIHDHQLTCWCRGLAGGSAETHHPGACAGVSTLMISVGSRAMNPSRSASHHRRHRRHEQRPVGAGAAGGTTDEPGPGGCPDRRPRHRLSGAGESRACDPTPGRSRPVAVHHHRCPLRRRGTLGFPPTGPRPGNGVGRHHQSHSRRGRNRDCAPTSAPWPKLRASTTCLCSPCQTPNSWKGGFPSGLVEEVYGLLLLLAEDAEERARVVGRHPRRRHQQHRASWREGAGGPRAISVTPATTCGPRSTTPTSRPGRRWRRGVERHPPAGRSARPLAGTDRHRRVDANRAEPHRVATGSDHQLRPRAHGGHRRGAGRDHLNPRTVADRPRRRRRRSHVQQWRSLPGGRQLLDEDSSLRLRSQDLDRAVGAEVERGRTTSWTWYANGAQATHSSPGCRPGRQQRRGRADDRTVRSDRWPVGW